LKSKSDLKLKKFLTMNSCDFMTNEAISYLAEAFQSLVSLQKLGLNLKG